MNNVTTNVLAPPSISLLVNSQTHIFTHLPDYMPVNILISPYTQRIKLVHHTNKIIKFGICFPQFGRCERMRFRPVWATIVPNGDRLESSEESAVRDRKSVWPIGKRKHRSCQLCAAKEMKGCLLVLDNANPTSCPAKSRTKPYIVPRRDAYFDGEMWSNAVRIIIYIS